MIIYEILSNEIPFNEISNENQPINLVVHNEKRPYINEKVPNKYKELIMECWSQNLDERPSFDQIENQLKFDNDFINVDDFNKFEDFIGRQLNSKMKLFLINMILTIKINWLLSIIRSDVTYSFYMIFFFVYFSLCFFFCFSFCLFSCNLFNFFLSNLFLFK